MLRLACDTVVLVVSMAATHTKEEVQLSQERRDAILTFILEYFTGPEIDRKTIGHFAFLGEVFGLTGKVKEMVGKTSSIQGRQELCVSIALAALNLALDDSPPEPTAHQLERKERREAAKQWKETVAAAGKSKEPVRQVKSPSIYNQRRSKLSPEELERVRLLTNERMARYRAKLKAKKAAQEPI